MHIFTLILILLLITIPFSSYAQLDEKILEQIHDQLESLESTNERNHKSVIEAIIDFNHISEEFYENILTVLTSNQEEESSILTEIKNVIEKNQQRSEKTQLANSLIQVSGIFIAIIGGFITTKMLSLGTERNRIFRRKTEIESEIENKRSVLEHYQNIVENLGLNWANQDINRFRSKLLKEPLLKEYSKDEIITKYEDHENMSANEHEIQVLDEQYDEIISEIKSELAEREKPKPQGLLGLSNLVDLSRLNDSIMISPPRNYDQYNDANEKLKIENSEMNHLKDQLQILEDDEKDLKSPRTWKFGFVLLFIATLTGVVMPSLWQHYGGKNPEITALVGFLISFIIFITYLGVEFQKALEIKNNDTKN